jgi:hypothetical protein
LQFELRRRMADGLLSRVAITSPCRGQVELTSLRDNWQYVNSTGGPVHSIKLNWVFQLPFGRDRRFGSGVSKWMDLLIGGWEFDGLMRLQSGTRFNYGNFRLVGMSEKELQDMFKFYYVQDADGKERIYMLPQDVIENSILAIYTASASTASGYSGASPTGRYLAPASGPDCVQYLGGQCQGTSLESHHQRAVVPELGLLVREANRRSQERADRSAHGPLQRLRRDQLHREGAELAYIDYRHGRQQEQLGGHPGRQRPERVAVPRRTHDELRVASDLVIRERETS